jgi:ATP-dependent Lhr-like helicase
VYVVQNTALVLLASRGWVESVKDETRCWPVIVHQILAMTQQHGGISAERCWQMLEVFGKKNFLELYTEPRRP